MTPTDKASALTATKVAVVATFVSLATANGCQRPSAVDETRQLPARDDDARDELPAPMAPAQGHDFFI
jgi:hypothetical protein